MNYAWRNPVNGTREQAPTLEEARFRLWQEIDRIETPDDPEKVHGANVGYLFAQEWAGSVSPTEEENPEGLLGWEAYAWACPKTGERMHAKDWESVVVSIRTNFPEHAPMDRVTVYRDRFVEMIRKGDPAPPEPKPPEPELDSAASLLKQILTGEYVDQQRAQTLALLWIANSLRRRKRRRRVHVRWSVNPLSRPHFCDCFICRFRRWLGSFLPEPPLFTDNETDRPPDSEETSQEAPEPLAAAPPPRDWKA